MNLDDLKSIYIGNSKVIAVYIGKTLIKKYD